MGDICYREESSFQVLQSETPLGEYRYSHDYQLTDDGNPDFLARVEVVRKKLAPNDPATPDMKCVSEAEFAKLPATDVYYRPVYGLNTMGTQTTDPRQEELTNPRLVFLMRSPSDRSIPVQVGGKIQIGWTWHQVLGVLPKKLSKDETSAFEKVRRERHYLPTPGVNTEANLKLDAGIASVHIKACAAVQGRNVVYQAPGTEQCTQDQARDYLIEFYNIVDGQKSK